MQIGVTVKFKSLDCGSYPLLWLQLETDVYVQTSFTAIIAHVQKDSSSLHAPHRSQMVCVDALNSGGICEGRGMPCTSKT